MTTENTERKTCKQLWPMHKNSRIRTIRRLWKAYQSGKEDTDEGNIYEYGLSFDYVAPGTFNGQREGYWRYQLGWGGPSDEFRFYSSSPTIQPYRITYSYMDWWDGYTRKLQCKDEALMLEIWDWFSESGSTQATFDKAIAEA